MLHGENTITDLSAWMTAAGIEPPAPATNAERIARLEAEDAAAWNAGAISEILKPSVSSLAAPQPLLMFAGAVVAGLILIRLLKN